jgi:hypothetical protein
LVDVHDRMDQQDNAERTEPTLAAEATEPIDRIDPADPTERIEPAEPMDRIDPFEPMLSSESCEASDHREPLLSLMPGILAPKPANGNATTRAARRGERGAVKVPEAAPGRMTCGPLYTQ